MAGTAGMAGLADTLRNKGSVGVTDGGARVAAPRRAFTIRIGAALTVLVSMLAVVRDPDVPLAAGVAVASLVPAAIVDLERRRLPNRLVGAAALATGATIAGALLWPGAVGPPIDVAEVAIGAASMAGPLLALHLLSPVAMGFGDVKAAVVLGAGLGTVDPQLAFVALFVGSMLTAVVGLATRRRSLPFGPGLIVGAATALCASGMFPGVQA